MITQCMNPECRKELHYLRSGRVIRTTLRQGAQTKVEHFWLCGDCHTSHDFLFAKDGHVSLIMRRPTAFPPIAAKPPAALDLMLVS